MRFFVPLVAFAMGVAALPTAEVEVVGVSNVLSAIQDKPYPHPPQTDNGEPTTIRASEEKRSVDVAKDTLAKRATLVVDIWADSEGRGRHEGLITETQRCYNLYNGWNDVISSLYVPGGFGCDFYVDSDCGGDHINVPGNYYFTSLGWFNDLASSYRCYN